MAAQTRPAVTGEEDQFLEELIPREWRSYAATGAVSHEVLEYPSYQPVMVIGQGTDFLNVLQRGTTVEFRTAPWYVPTRTVPFSATLLQISDEYGNSVGVNRTELGGPKYDGATLSIQYATTASTAPGFYMLVFTAAPSAAEPGYIFDMIPFLLLPDDAQAENVAENVKNVVPAPNNVVQQIAPTAPALGAAPAPQPQQAPPAPNSAPPAEAAPQPAQTAEPAPQVEASAEQQATTTSQTIGAAAPGGDIPAWVFPTVLGAAGAAVLGLLGYRIIRAAHDSARIARLGDADRPDDAENDSPSS